MRLRQFLYKINELDLFKLCLFFEARGEPEIGIKWVGFVIRNRVYSNMFPNTYREVLLQKKQFSCFSEKILSLYYVSDTLNILKIFSNSKWEICNDIAEQIYYGLLLPEKDDILWYCNKNLKDSWHFKKLRLAFTIHNHSFFTLKK